jgi:hypothetical protein
MSGQFYSDARLYDRLFPGGEQAVDFYRAKADGNRRRRDALSSWAPAGTIPG